MTHFDNDLGIHIAMIHRYGSTFIGRALGDLDIGSGQHAYLLAIADMPGSSQELLSRLFGVDKANTARAVKRLEDKAYIRREPDPEDARALRLFLTPEGEACIERIRAALKDWNSVLLAGIPIHLKASAHELLAGLANAAQASIE
jgi:DNA-binding MarR family transcriptional regulator